MIFNLNKENKHISRRRGIRLIDIEWKEKDFEDLMFKNMDALFPDDELLLIMQSRNYQEEPDLMALDKDGTLYIFELKRWESEDVNLLQVLRYGQKFGQYSYEELNKTYLQGQDILEALNNKFETSLTPKDINQKQKFILVTNGLDYKTRASIEYWQGLNISSWISAILTM